jgi:hypothetical protein
MRHNLPDVFGLAFEAISGGDRQDDGGVQQQLIKYLGEG